MSFFDKYASKIKFEGPSYKIAAAAFAIFLCASVIFAEAWSAPAGNPPDKNSAAPLNITDVSQMKDGTLGLKGLLVNGSSSLQDKVQITSGNPGAGKVLVSDVEGNARWVDYVQARKNADRLRCPNGSSRISLNGKTFCGYWKTVSGYCDAFGKTYDPLVACYDKGIGRNHGVTPFANGCYSWEGPKNYGGPGLKFYCEKLSYTPKSASDCTDPKATVGTLNDTSLSPNPITTCNIVTPTTYKGCNPGEMQLFNYCYPGYFFSSPVPLRDIATTTISCMPGWTNYLGNCI